MTVPEVLISMGILSLVLLGVYSLLQFALRWHSKMDDTVAVYQETVKASNRLSSDIGTGSVVSFIYEVDGLAFASARPDTGKFQMDSTGRLLWHKHILYYIENGNLYRNEVPINPPITNPGSTPDLATLKSQMSGQGMLLAEDVSDLEVIPGSGAAVKFKVAGKRVDQPNSITIETRMTFRQ